jgi:hypothetical protein
VVDRHVYGRTHDCKNPVDPAEATSVVNNKAHEERTTRRAKSDKQSPQANVGSTLLLEESLSDNARTRAARRTNKECSECSADSHGSV